MGVTTEYNPYKNMKDTDVCAEFEMLEVKVPIIFFGTVGFSPRRDGRYMPLPNTPSLLIPKIIATSSPLI